ncbi:histidine kinase [Helicobacter labacensis]|uniref:hypothetical protein n=1 Tax=Helicobacter labacensis TaxID=2316079 RepID=UPI001F297745|nr:hypothetical protein [Helicobacter labacensis]
MGYSSPKGETKDSTTPLKDTSKPNAKKAQKQIKALESEFIGNIVHDYTPLRGASNQSLIAKLKDYIGDEDFIRNLSKETLVNIEPGLARANDYLMYEQVAKMEEMIQKIEKLDSQAVSPGMRASLAHMQKLKTQQEKELLEIKDLYEKLIAKWEKAHGQKANAVFPAKYTPKQGAQTKAQKQEPKPSSAGAKPPLKKDLPTKTKLTQDLSPQEIKSHIEGWDLQNPNPKNKAVIAKVEGKELEQLSQEFKFKAITR